MNFEIKLGDILLERGNKDWISEAIEEISHSDYSHSATYVKPGELIEANGFRHTGYQALDYYDNCADIFTCDSLTDVQRQEIVDYLESQIGGHYDYILLFLEAFRYLFGIMLPYKEKPKTKICSVLVRDAYLSVGIDLCPGVKYPSPKDISESKLLRKIGSL